MWLRSCQVVLKEYPERTISIYTELHDLIEAVGGELKTYNDNGGGEDDGDSFNANDGLWTVRDHSQNIHVPLSEVFGVFHAGFFLVQNNGCD